MTLYKITVYDGFFNKELTGEFYGSSQSAAIKEAKEFYAQELDCQESDIKLAYIVDITYKIEEMLK